MLTFLLFLLLAIPQSRPLAEYQTIVVERFTVEESQSTSKFPAKQETVIELGIYDRLKEAGLFASVIHTDDAKAGNLDAVALEGTVVAFNPGNRAARIMIGMGAGSSKLKMRFTLRDRQSGRQLTTFVYEGRFYGFTASGGNRQAALADTVSDIAKKLLEDLRKAR